jgi:hypothetical protein
MIVDNLNVMDRTVTPDEADAPLIVDPNAVLAASRLPLRASSRLPGGCRKAIRSIAAANMASFRWAGRTRSDGNPLGVLPFQTASASLVLKLWIMMSLVAEDSYVS